MNKTVIQGQNIVTGNSISISNGKIIVGDKDVTSQFQTTDNDDKGIRIVIQNFSGNLTVNNCDYLTIEKGDVDELNASNVESIEVRGNVKNLETKNSTNFISGNVEGDVSMVGGKIKCGTVKGDLKTSGSNTSIGTMNFS